MATEESRITATYAATIPGSIRELLDVQPGDKLRWTVADAGELRVEVVRQRELSTSSNPNRWVGTGRSRTT